MALARIIAFSTDLPQPALSRLEASADPAWLIDVTGGRVLAANAAGADLLGLDPHGAAPTLDASTPALRRLRALASERTDTARERLVMWGLAGAFRRECAIAIQREGSRVLALVSASAEDEAATELQTPGPAQPARDADEVPRALRANLAHELKTPLSAIAAAAEIMKDERFGPLGTARYIDYASDILGSARHVLGVIDRMLADGADVADVTPRPLVFAEVDVGEVLRASVSQLAPLAEQAGLSLSLELTPRLPRLVADATSLRQIVFNLVTNALKFTGQGGRITVAARYEGAGPLTVSVSDTGIGMAEGEVVRLLASARGAKIGRRNGASGRNGPASGLGLGLPLVQALAAANGAELVIESAPGQGTSAAVVFAKDRVIPV